ncbi:MAG: DUF3793 family protein [Coriobacteriaceae bacterium]|nr:DUF3793 family protein [Coriobacteriaceae bacterium]
MGQGMEVFLGDPSEARTLEDGVEAEFLHCLVLQAGLVISGDKPCAVFGFTPRATAGSRTASLPAVASCANHVVAVYEDKASGYGVSLAVLARRSCGPMVMAWRPELVSFVLADDESRALLASADIDVGSADDAMRCMARRLRSYFRGHAPFPHELGVLLGYPVRDVRGFMHDGGRGAVACGRWKVYGDPAAAERRFAELARRESALRERFCAGCPVGALIA